MADGGSVSLDWAPPDDGAPLPDDAPLVMLAHGLAGASDENYIRSFTDVAARQRRWRVVVYNRRGHGDGEHPSACGRRMQHAPPHASLSPSRPICCPVL